MRFAPLVAVLVTLAVAAAATPVQADDGDRRWTVEEDVEVAGQEATVNVTVDCRGLEDGGVCSAEADSDPDPPTAFHREETVTYEGNTLRVILHVECSASTEDAPCWATIATRPGPTDWAVDALKDTCFGHICVL